MTHRILLLIKVSLTCSRGLEIPELTEDEYDSIPPPLLAKSNDGSP
jgi:hypothetical protein